MTHRCLKCRNKMNACKNGSLGSQVFCDDCRKAPGFASWLGGARAEKLLAPLVRSGRIPANVPVQIALGLRIVAEG